MNRRWSRCTRCNIRFDDRSTFASISAHLGGERLELDSLADDLSAPISDGAPVGVDLRESADPENIWYVLKDARAAARDVERTLGVNDVSEIQSEAGAHWRTVVQQGATALRDSSKDLEIASWITEGLTRLHGFAGAASGLSLMQILVEKYWDDGLFPVADEGDTSLEDRVAPVSAFNGLDGEGTMIRPLKMVAFVDSDDPGPIAYWQYEQAVALSRITDPDAIAARTANGALTLDDIKNAAARESEATLIATYENVGAALGAYQSLVSLLVAKAGDEAPPSSTMTKTFDEIQRAIRSLAPYVIRTDAAEEGEAMDDMGDSAAMAAAPNGAPRSADGAIAGREEALRQLTQIASYFERTEPTSMIPLALRDLVRRARMPLTEILHELLPDEPTARENLLLRAGIRPTQSEDK